ncbi:hypothetical protein ACFX11_043821 [Malus domestica]
MGKQAQRKLAYRFRLHGAQPRLKPSPMGYGMRAGTQRKAQQPIAAGHAGQVHRDKTQESYGLPWEAR